MKLGTFLGLVIVDGYVEGKHLSALFYDGSSHRINDGVRPPLLALPIDGDQGVGALHFHARDHQAHLAHIKEHHHVTSSGIEQAFRIASYYAARFPVTGKSLEQSAPSFSKVRDVVLQSGPEAGQRYIRGNDPIGLYKG